MVGIFSTKEIKISISILRCDEKKNAAKNCKNQLNQQSLRSSFKTTESSVFTLANGNQNGFSPYGFGRQNLAAPATYSVVSRIRVSTATCERTKRNT